MTRPGHEQIEASGIRVELDLGIGHIARIEVERDGRTVAPFHRAPWADDPTPPEGIEDAPHLARLSGDFFCAPFSKADVEPAPLHGWPANVAWTPLGTSRIAGGVTARFELERRVMGARIIKEFTLRDGHPFLYQRHVFEGGDGALPVASHPMVSLPTGGRMTFSPKRWAETPDSPIESDPARGRSLLAYPAKSDNLSRFPTADGGTVDLGRYPLGEEHEDFAMLVEAEGRRLGWSAVLREQQGDLALMLKDPARLPVTMLWFSHGGRLFAPWSGRHLHTLGVEDGCSWFGKGHAASVADNPLSRQGIATAIHLMPGGSVDVRHVIGAVPVSEGFGPVADVRLVKAGLEVRSEAGAVLPLPFDTGFLGGVP